jgi:hypothetical protein
VIENCAKSHPITGNSKDMDTVCRGILITAMFTARTHCVGMTLGQVTVTPGAKKDVIANKAFKVGELRLSCFTHTFQEKTNDKDKGDTAQVCVAGLSMVFLLRPHNMASGAEGSKGTPSCCPYWFVPQTALAAANVDVEDTEMTVCGYKVVIPELVNTKAIHKGDSILRVKV